MEKIQDEQPSVVPSYLLKFESTLEKMKSRDHRHEMGSVKQELK